VTRPTTAAPELVEAFERLTAAALRRRGLDSETLPPTQRVALAAVVCDGPMRLRALAERMGTTDATASRTVDALEAGGLVQRDVAPDDRRGVVVGATDTGRARLEERRRQFAETLEAGLADLPAEDAERLVRLLGDLAEALNRR
jgi:DNA-binding MarR family transcriptional regulator